MQKTQNNVKQWWFNASYFKEKVSTYWLLITGWVMGCFLGEALLVGLPPCKCSYHTQEVSVCTDGAFMKHLPSWTRGLFSTLLKVPAGSTCIVCSWIPTALMGLALESSAGNHSPLGSKHRISVILTAALQIAIIAPSTQVRQSDFPKVVNPLSGVARMEALVWDTVTAQHCLCSGMVGDKTAGKIYLAQAKEKKGRLALLL